MPWNDTNEPPWKAVQIRGHWRVTTDRGNPADEYDVESSGDEEVARLQASAPESLKFVERFVERRCLFGNNACLPSGTACLGCQARAILAKVKGQS